jgi:dTDP-4-dehydrorhamnose 3,5-epimerase
MKTDNVILIDGLVLFSPLIHHDSRGWFFESFNLNMELNEFVILQTNHSYTKNAYTFRGFHHQSFPFSQDKLIRCIRGGILDIVIDLRPNSPTFLKSISIELDEFNKKLMFIPKGCFHGFLTLSDDVEVIYEVNQLYNKESEITLNPFDSSLNMIDWKGYKILHLSEKDMNGKSLEDVKTMLL